LKKNEIFEYDLCSHLNTSFSRGNITVPDLKKKNVPVISLEFNYQKGRIKNNFVLNFIGEKNIYLEFPNNYYNIVLDELSIKIGTKNITQNFQTFKMASRRKGYKISVAHVTMSGLEVLSIIIGMIVILGIIGFIIGLVVSISEKT